MVNTHGIAQTNAAGFINFWISQQMKPDNKISGMSCFFNPCELPIFMSDLQNPL